MTAAKVGGDTNPLDARNLLIIEQLKKNLGEHICFTPVKDKMGGFTVAAVVYQESGYTPLYTLFYGDQAEMASVCKILNEYAGVSEAKAIEWITSSMFPTKRERR